MSASQRTVYLWCLQNGVSDLQARNLALMFSQVLKKVSQQNQTTLSHGDVALLLKDAIAKQATSANLHRNFLVE